MFYIRNIIQSARRVPIYVHSHGQSPNTGSAGVYGVAMSMNYVIFNVTRAMRLRFAIVSINDCDHEFPRIYSRINLQLRINRQLLKSACGARARAHEAGQRSCMMEI